MANINTTDWKVFLNNSGIQVSNPALYQTILGLINAVDSLSTNLFATQSILGTVGAGIVTPVNVTGFTATIVSALDIELRWTSLGAGVTYEIRRGTVWETAIYQTTTLANVVPIVPLLAGTYTFLIKAINSVGVSSVTAMAASITITGVGPITLNVETIDNNVNLNWNLPTSTFLIDHYIVNKNGIPLGRINSTFFSYTDTAGGLITYTVQAFDIAGNFSAVTSSSTVSIVVGTPTDFIFNATLNDSPFSGTPTNVLIDNIQTMSLIAPVNITETWTDHFVNNGYTDIQDQITAGNLIYIEPNLSPGTYVKVFDFGVSFNNQLVQALYTFNNAVGAIVVTWKLEWSPDNITYTLAANAQSAFVTSTFRYIRVTVTFTAGNVLDLIQVTKLFVNLSIRTVLDSGSISSLSTDVGGTLVTFSKVFLKIVSVTATPIGIIATSAVVTAITLTTFKVAVFDITGARVTATVNWKAHGVIQ